MFSVLVINKCVLDGYILGDNITRISPGAGYIKKLTIITSRNINQSEHRI